jgi:hypothetical protein
LILTVPSKVRVVPESSKIWYLAFVALPGFATHVADTSVSSSCPWSDAFTRVVHVAVLLLLATAIP